MGMYKLYMCIRTCTCTCTYMYMFVNSNQSYDIKQFLSITFVSTFSIETQHLAPSSSATNQQSLSGSAPPSLTLAQWQRSLIQRQNAMRAHVSFDASGKFRSRVSLSGGFTGFLATGSPQRNQWLLLFHAECRCLIYGTIEITSNLPELSFTPCEYVIFGILAFEKIRA